MKHSLTPLPTMLTALLLAIGPMCFVGCNSSPKVKTILSPQVAQLPERLTVDKVILTDSMTILDFSITPDDEGSWIMIAPESYITTDGGEKLAIMGTKNIPIGEMPTETFRFRDYTFSLIFPPISRGTKTIDFSEGVAGGWTVSGISLEENSPTIAYADTTDNMQYTFLAAAYDREVERALAQEEAARQQEIEAAQRAARRAAQEEQVYYCRYCGRKYKSIEALTSIMQAGCNKSPNGRHQVY